MAKQKSKVEQLYDKPVKPESKASDEDKSILATARERARRGADYWRDNWEAAEDDLRFLSGEQWPSQVRTERELEQRPCLVNNVLPTFVDQVLGDQRQNRPSIKVSPVEVARVPGSEKGETLKVSNMAGTQDYELAEVFTGVIKNIEYNCDAETSYDIAFQSAVESGIGYLRVRHDYISDDSFDQDIVIEEIENQFSVTIDPLAKKRDKSDAGWCLVDDQMDKETFKELYPGAATDPVNSEASGDLETWFRDNTVRVSEYFTREPYDKEIALLSDGRAVAMEELEPVVDELLKKDISIVRTRKVKSYKVFWRLITGIDVLEGPIELPCSTIPIVPVWGKSLTIKDKTIFRSIIRHSKDAQRMANYWESAATENIALAPKQPYIGAEGHVEGYETQWQTANTTNHSILTYVPQYQGDPGPRREVGAAMPAAEITMGMNAVDKIKSTIGIYDASLGAQGAETSGRAIIARQRQGDRGSYAFIDNLTKAIRRVGKLLVEMIPRVYDTERVVRLKFADESEDFVKLNEQIYDEDTNTWVTINDLNVAKYDVVVTTGPAFATQRIEAAEAMIQFAQAVPAAAAVMADLIAQNMDWPGADVISERLKKIVPPNVLTSEEREKLAEDMPEDQGPTPEQQLQAQELEVRSLEAQAKIASAQADVAEAEADTLKAQLETEDAKQKLAMIDDMASGGNQFEQVVRELVAQAMAELAANQQNVNAQ
jgi:hypothetical protein